MLSNLDTLSDSCKTTNKQNGLFFYLETVSVCFVLVCSSLSVFPNFLS